MNFPREFEQFLQLMSFLSGMLLSLEEEEQDYKLLLLEKAHKLEPHIKKAYPVIAELYTTSPEEAYEIFQEAIKDIPRQSLQEIQTLTSRCISDEVMGQLFDNEEEEKQFLENELHNFIAALRVFSMNMVANNQYHTSINQLVLDAEKGDDQALFLAIHIDPLVELVPVIAERISHAQITGKKHFLDQLTKSRVANREDKRKKNNRLNFFLILFYRFGILGQLTQQQMAEIFINRLEVYDKDDSSLFKYIGRWKKSLNQLDLRHKNKLKRSKT